MRFMSVKSKKVELLIQFTQKLSELDPMGIGTANDLEYEPEALSALSRFSEAGFHLAESKTHALPVAIGIVADVMKFWFDSQVYQDEEQMEKWRKIASVLLDIYMNAWAHDNEKTNGVEHITIG
jgi:hypothetical protein